MAAEAIDEVERALIGGILRNPDSLHYAVACGLADSDFASDAAREAYRSILSLDLDRAPVTPANVAHRASQSVERVTAWRDEGLASAVNFHAREVKQASAKRRLAQRLRKLASVSEMMSPEDIVAEAAKLAETSLATTSSQPVSDFVDQAMDSLDPSKRARFFYSTGDPSLDAAMGGGISQTDEQLVIAADTGCGKTTKALNIAASIGHRTGLSPLFFSLEMGGISIALKLIGAAAGVPVRKSFFTTEERARLAKAADWVRGLPLQLADVAPEVGTIEAEVRAHIRNFGETPIFVDYIQLMRSTERSTVERVEQVSQTLRRLGRNLRVPVIALAQLNREGAKKQAMPTREDIHGSGQVAKDATTVLMMWRPSREEPEVRGYLDKRRFEPCDEHGRIIPPRLSWEWHESGQRFKRPEEYD